MFGGVWSMYGYLLGLIGYGVFVGLGRSESICR